MEILTTNSSHHATTGTPSHEDKAWLMPQHSPPTYSDRDTISRALPFLTTPKTKERNRKAGSFQTSSSTSGAIRANRIPKTSRKRIHHMIFQAQVVVSIPYPLPMSIFWMPPASTGSFGLEIFGLYMMHVMYLEWYRCVVPRTVAPQTALLFSRYTWFRITC
mmetsp:Transcript_8221/g.29186  ORF Transcript_8221/g.29186 Transcript_8221/m.29186 type:complete len:162 (+) Transcript_8221:210-695(+)